MFCPSSFVALRSPLLKLLSGYQIVRATSRGDMARRSDRLGRVLLVFLSGVLATRAFAASLDQEGDIRLGVRAYTAARVGTQDTEIQLIEQAPGRITQRSLTFPVSAA